MQRRKIATRPFGGRHNPVTPASLAVTRAPRLTHALAQQCLSSLKWVFVGVRMRTAMVCWVLIIYFIFDIFNAKFRKCRLHTINMFN